MLDTERLFYFDRLHSSPELYRAHKGPSPMNATLSPDSGASNVVSIEQAQDFIGKALGCSPWLEITQERVNQFAQATGDFQFIHIDPERATKESPFGSAIAHGFLTLSLLSMLSAQSPTIKIQGCSVAINYGLDKVRFVNPVPVGSRIRAHFTLISAIEKSPHSYLVKHKITVEIEGKGKDKPAMIAEWLGMSVV